MTKNSNFITKNKLKCASTLFYNGYDEKEKLILYPFYGAADKEV